MPNSALESRVADDSQRVTTPEFATLALDSAWSDAYSWAVRNQVLGELIAIMNASLLRDIPVALGSLLAVISSDEAFETLTDWANHEPAALPLSRLNQAITNDPSVLSFYPPLTQAISASNQFRGDTPIYYLIAALAEAIPTVGYEDRVWLEKLRLWVLTHALDRAKPIGTSPGNVQDNLLRLVASKLRLINDKKKNWLSLFIQLKSGSLDFERLNKSISRRATSLLEDEKQSNLTGVERQLLQTIVKVAARVHAQDTSQDINLRLVALPDGFISAPYPPAAPCEEIEDEDSVGSESLKGAWIQTTDEDGTDIFEAQTDSRKSYAHQTLQGNEVLLYFCEELQYLPYSWDKLNPAELTRLRHWIEMSCDSNRPDLKYLGVVAWLALLLGRSTRRILDIPISPTPGQEWTIDPSSIDISRLPPRRTPGWMPTSETIDWVVPLAEQQNIHPPEKKTHILHELLKNSVELKSLGNLWNPTWGEQPEKALAHELRSIFPRITGSKVGKTFIQRAFQETGDATFARLIGSNPKTSLPGSCAYASWPSQAVTTFLNPELSAELASDNAMGSRLDPIEKLLRQSITEAANKIEKLRLRNHAIEFHNAYVAFLVCKLLAATGVRPNRDPFENHQQFDFSERFIYVSDKVSNSQRQGRPVPIPQNLCKELIESYPKHLAAIAKIFPALSDGVTQIIQNTATPALPYFFFISSDSQSWESVSESAIKMLGLFDWPLPLNHFRHRFAQQLRKRNVDPEVIDSILGHIEAGTPTHGDYSFRVWQKDIQHSTQAIEEAYASLSFPEIKPWSGISTVTPAAAGASSASPRLFGSALRDQKRLAAIKESIETANEIIGAALEGRSISDLSEKEFDSLSRQLLFKHDNMPHPRGPLQYRVLLKKVEREWREKGKRANISKRYQALPEVKPFFDSNAPGALEKYGQLRAIVSTISDINISRVSRSRCAIIAVMLLSIESRICNAELLTDVIKGKNFRITSMNNKLYIEYSKVLPKGIFDAPVQRFRISERTAKYLDRLLSARNSSMAQELPPEVVQIGIALNTRVHPEDLSALISTITACLNQVNALTFPGIVAGYLGGRIETYSLSWRDWARMELGQAIRLPEAKDDSGDLSISPNAEDTYISATPHSTSPCSASISSQLSKAKEFLDELSQVINDPRAADKGYSLENRKTTGRKVQQLISRYAGEISNAIELLARWTSSLLFRKNGGQYIQMKSILRYLTALKDGFVEVFYCTDLQTIDDEEITELYSLFLSTLKVKNKKFVAERLSEFHKWAHIKYAVQNPDWSDLPEMAATLRVSPGYISEAEYLKAIQLVQNHTSLDGESRIAAIQMLMLCYRFGLRGSEAFGLRRCDLEFSDALTIVYVQNNRFRKLKTAASRRQVPLLCNLSPIELSTLTKFISHYVATHGNHDSAPLFFSPESPSLPLDGVRIKRHVIECLKIATSNPAINLHHARHSFANSVCANLYEAAPNLEWAHSSQLPEIEYMLLGRKGATRRKMWALSRLLGHAIRDTTARNYLHILSCLSDHEVGITDAFNSGEFRNQIQVDKFEKLAEVDTSILSQIKPELNMPTTSNLIKLMRLATCGKSISAGAADLNLDGTVAEGLQNLLDLVGNRLKLSRSKFTEDDPNTPEHLRLIRRVRESTWARLIKEIVQFESSSASPHPRLSIDEIAEMVGATGQLLIWKENHFQLLDSFIKFCRLFPDDYRFVRSNQTNNKLELLSAQYGMNYCTAKDQPKGDAIQLDKATTADNQYVVPERISFILRKNDTRSVRTSTDLLVAFIAYALSS